MKKSLVIMAIIALMLVSLTGCTGSAKENPAASSEQAKQAKEVTFKMRLASHYEPDHIIAKAWAQFCKNIESASQGQIKVEFFPAGQLGKGQEYFEMLANGTLDMAIIPNSYAIGHIPELDLINIPGMLEGEWLAFNAFQQGLNELYAPLFEKRGIKVLGWHTCGATGLFTKEEVRNPEKIKGMPVRGAGECIDKWFRRLGASVINVPGSEIYTAAQRGLIKGCRTSVASYIARGLFEVLPYATWDVPNGNTVVFIAVPMKLWDSLPSHLQILLQALVDETCMRATANLTYYDKVEAVQVCSEKGSRVYSLTPEEVALFNEKGARPVYEEYAEKHGDFMRKMEKIREQVEPFYIAP